MFRWKKKGTYTLFITIVFCISFSFFFLGTLSMDSSDEDYLQGEYEVSSTHFDDSGEEISMKASRLNDQGVEITYINAKDGSSIVLPSTVYLPETSYTMNLEYSKTIAIPDSYDKKDIIFQYKGNNGSYTYKAFVSNYNSKDCSMKIHVDDPLNLPLGTETKIIVNNTAVDFALLSNVQQDVTPTPAEKISVNGAQTKLDSYHGDYYFQIDNRITANVSTTIDSTAKVFSIDNTDSSLNGNYWLLICISQNPNPSTGVPPTVFYSGLNAAKSQLLSYILVPIIFDQSTEAPIELTELDVQNVFKEDAYSKGSITYSSGPEMPESVVNLTDGVITQLTDNPITVRADGEIVEAIFKITAASNLSIQYFGTTYSWDGSVFKTDDGHILKGIGYSDSGDRLTTKLPICLNNGEVRIFPTWDVSEAKKVTVEVLSSYTVVSIGSNLFDTAVTELSSLTIPESVVTIKGNAFSNVQISSFIANNKAALEKLGDGAFGTNSVNMDLGEYQRLASIGSGAIPFGSTLSGSNSYYSVMSSSLLVDSGSNTVISVFGEINRNTSIPSNLSFSKGSLSGYNADLYWTEAITYDALDGADIQVLTIADDISTIPAYQFNGVRLDVSKVIIPASVTEIGSYSFATSSVEEVLVEIGSRLEIQDFAFSDCYYLSTVKITASSDYGGGPFDIGNRAFFRSPGLKVFEFGQQINLVNIGSYAFCYDPLIQFGWSENEIIIPKTLTNLGEGCFSGGFSVSTTVNASIHYPTNSFIDAFRYPSLYNFQCIVYGSESDSTWSPDSLRANWKNLEVSANVKLNIQTDASLFAIPMACFAGRCFTEVDMSGSSIEEIGDFAFFRSAGKITFGESLDCIGTAAFEQYNYYNTEDMEVILPQKVTVLGNFAFFNSRVDSLIITEGSQLEQIGMSALIGSNTMERQVNLSNCTMLKYYGKNAAEVTLPAGVIELEPWAGLNDRIININNVILDCDDSLTISQGITTIDSHVLSSDIKAIEVTGNDLFIFEDGMLSFGNGSQKVLVRALCTEDMAVSGYTKIGDYAFAHQKVKSITLSESVKTVGKGFLFQSDVEILNLPEGIEFDDECLYGSPDALFVCVNGTGYEDVFGEQRILYFNESTESYIQRHSDETQMEVCSASINGGTVSVELGWTAGYTANDVNVFIVGSEDNLEQTNGVYQVGVGSKIAFTTKDRHQSDSMVNIRFNANGGSVQGNGTYTIQLPRGLTMVDSDWSNLIVVQSGYDFEFWSLDGTSEYDWNSVLLSDIELKAIWGQRAPMITIAERYGYITCETQGGVVIASGDTVANGTQVAFSATVFPGYEDASWSVDGGAILVSGGYSDLSKELVISVTGDVTVTIIAKSVSQSGSGTQLKSLMSDGLPTSSQLDDVVRVATISGTVRTDSQVWSGMSSVPLIVGDYTYLRFGGFLCKLETDTGYVTKRVVSTDISAFYGYVTYGDGVILDNNAGIAYDLDLNPLYTFDDSLITHQTYYNEISYYDGKFYVNSYDYGTITSKIYRFDANQQSNHTAEMELVYDVGAYWREWGTPIFVSNYAYMLLASIGADQSHRVLAAIDLDGNSPTVLLNVDGYIANNLMDDGWLTYDDGILYLTTYTSGLFDARVSTDPDSIICVPVDGTSFGNVTKISLVTDDSSPIVNAVTNLVVYKDRGYVAAGKTLFVLNMTAIRDCVRNGISINLNAVKIYSEATCFSHGGIVVETSYANKDNGFEVYIYNVAYDIKNGIYVHTDNVNKTSPSEPAIRTDIPANPQYSSQAIRSGHNGEMVWYNDTGSTYIYTTPEKNPYFFFIQDGNVAQWYQSYGATASDALRSLGSSTVTLNSINTLSTLYGKDAEGWKIWALDSKSLGEYEWTELDNLYSVKYDVDHYYVISKSMPNDQTTYQYLNSNGQMSTYSFKENIGDRSIIGMRLISGAQSDVSFVEFKDGQDTVSKVIGTVGDPVDIDFPQHCKFGYIARWVKTDDLSSGDLSEKYVTSLIGTQFVSGGSSYSVVWEKMVSHYTLNAELEKDSSKGKIDVSIVRDYGAEDPSDLVIYVIAHYEDGRFISISAAPLMTSGIGECVATVSSVGLESVMVQLIKGYPGKDIPSYYSDEVILEPEVA